jgi:hypothetical protein
VPSVRSCCAALALGILWGAPAGAQRPYDWREDWALDAGLALERDAEGFEFPTALAFVPRPGPAPEDPLYFVAELGGTLKVVRNDRRVQVFATDLIPRRPPLEPLPSGRGETGMAGLCLDPAHGFVFVTYAYADADGTTRNAILRLDAEPGRFGLAPHARLPLGDVLRADRSAYSHQIGPCQVDGGLLYVGIGDGTQSFKAQDLDSSLGKVLRMTLDGRPAPGNPHLAPGAPPGAMRGYVYASGFRNPFSLVARGGRVFVAQNGYDLDAFAEVDAGRDFGWRGSDWAVAMNAAMVFAPSVAPVQMDWIPPDAQGVPASLRGHFVVATSGRPDVPGPSANGEKALLALDYDWAARRMRRPPWNAMRLRAERLQSLVGAAHGPDGLYVLPLFPDPEGRSAVLRIVDDGGQPWPWSIRRAAARVVMRESRCDSCHGTTERPGWAPSLEPVALYQRLSARLAAPEYAQQVARLDASEQAPFPAWRDVRREVLALEGPARVERWIAARLLEPRFDDPSAAMPALPIGPDEAAAVARHLVRQALGAERERRDAERRRRLRGLGALGLVAAGLTSALLLRRFRRR